VDEGRDTMNFSEFTEGPSAQEFAEVVNGGEMPPFQYTIIHPDAKLTDAEKKALVAGYAAGLAASGAASGGTPEPSPSATPTATSTAAADGDAGAVAVINARCGSCHPVDQALSFRAGSETEAQGLIDTMVQQGAEVTADEQLALVRYFTQ
jgi:cytochrome c551/c552